MAECILNRRFGKSQTLQPFFSWATGGTTTSGDSRYSSSVSMPKGIYFLSCGGGNTAGNQNRIYIQCYNGSSWSTIIGSDTGSSGSGWSTILDNSNGTYTSMRGCWNFGNGTRVGHFYASAALLQ